MEIKKNLKEMDIKISRMASDFGISRPTLDTYIDSYERTGVLPNGGFQAIFDYLFSEGELMDTVEFAERYDYVKRVMINASKKGVVSRNLNNKSEKMLKQVELIPWESLDFELLAFVNLFVKHKDDSLVKNIYMYFNYTNGYEKINDDRLTVKDKALYSNLCRIFELYNNNEIEVLHDYYEKVLEKNTNKYDCKDIKVNDSDIVDYIKNNLDDNKKIDLNALKQMIEQREAE